MFNSIYAINQFWKIYLAMSYHQEKTEDDYTENYSNPDIKHTAPQHRQYLSNEGYGFGTPYQR